MESNTNRGGRGAIWRRLVVTFSLLQTLAVLTQAWLAGGFLTGLTAALETHRTMAFGVIQWLALFNLVSAILWWRPGHGPGWPIAVTGVSLLAVGAQIGFGFANQLQVHIPLGVSIFGLNLWLATRLLGYERKKS